MIEPKILKEVTRNLNILYAEDEETLRTGMVKSLKRLFKNVYVAEDGYEGVELFKKNKIDLIISDINMPNIDGIEMFQIISDTVKPLSPPPFITLTAHNEPELLIKLIDLGIDKFLLKPVNKEKMIDSLYKVCVVIDNNNLITKYQAGIEEAYEEAEKQKRILQNKLKSIALDKKTQKFQIDKRRTTEEKKVALKKEENHFEMLDNEDSDELEDLCIEMDAYVTMMFQVNHIDEKYIFKFSNAIQKYASILNHYPLFYELCSSMQILAEDIKKHKENVKEKQQEFAAYFESLHFTLENFRIKIWKNEVSDPTFFNASFLCDINLIVMALSNADGRDNDIDFF